MEKGTDHHTCRPWGWGWQVLCGRGACAPVLLLGLDFWCLDGDLWNADRRPLN